MELTFQINMVWYVPIHSASSIASTYKSNFSDEIVSTVLVPCLAIRTESRVVHMLPLECKNPGQL